MQDCIIQNDFSWGQISGKFALRSDLAIHQAAVLKAKNIMPYVYGGMFKRFGLNQTGKLEFLNNIDTVKICHYEASNTCFLVFLTEDKIYFYDINTKKISDKKVEWKAREEAQKYKFAQIAQEIDYAQGGTELILTHRLFHIPKVITYSEAMNDWDFGDFKVEMPNFWIKELPRDNIKIKLIYSQPDTLSIGIITEGNIDSLKKSLKNVNLCERNGTGRCYVGDYKEQKVDEMGQTVHIFAAAPFKDFSDAVSKGFVNQEYFILKRPMWEQSDPAVVAFHESRLVFGGYEDDKIALYFSKVNDFHNFGEGLGNDDDAFIGGIASGERQQIVGLKSAPSLQIFTSKGIYVVMHGGVLPLTAENLSITMQVHIGCGRLYGKLLNGETIFVGADQSNVYSLQSRNVNTYMASNLSLMTSDLVREPIALSCNSFIETGSDKSAFCDKKHDYLFIVNKFGNLVICQSLANEEKAAWSTVETLGGKFKYAFSYQEKVLFIVERNGKHFFEELDFKLAVDKHIAEPDVFKMELIIEKEDKKEKAEKIEGREIEVELELLPFLSLKSVRTQDTALMFHRQIIGEAYVYFEGDPALKVNGQPLNQKAIHKISGGISVGHVTLAGEWNYGQTLKITYNGTKDLKIYSVVVPVKRG